MSLSTQFQEIIKKINKIKFYAENINSNHPEYNLFTHQNQWKWTGYPIPSGSSTYPTLSDANRAKNLGVKYSTRYFNDGATYDQQGDQYIGIQECYVFAKQDFNLGVTLHTDDNGTLYHQSGSQIDTTSGTLVIQNTSCKNTSGTIKFKKGLNKLIIIYQEGGGGDYGYLTAPINANANIIGLYGSKD